MGNNRIPEVVVLPQVPPGRGRPPMAGFYDAVAERSLRYVPGRRWTPRWPAPPPSH
jgi:hypothetical protein